MILQSKHLSTGLPITFTIATYLLMDHLKANQFAWGIYITFMVLVWITYVFAFIKSAYFSKHAEIMEDGRIKIS